MPSQPAYHYEPHHRSYSRARAAAYDDDDEAPSGKRAKATGRACLQCGATSTPQWREGPQGELPATRASACACGRLLLPLSMLLAPWLG